MSRTSQTAQSFPAQAEQDGAENLALTQRLRIIDKKTGIKGHTWDRYLNKKDAWSNWKKGRAQNKVLSLETTIADILREYGYNVPDDLLSGRFDFDQFIALFKAQQPAHNYARHTDFRSEPGDEVPDDWIDPLKRFCNVGRASQERHLLPVIGSSSELNHRFIYHWLNSHDYSPMIPFYHFDATNYNEDHELITEIAYCFSPASEVSSTHAQKLQNIKNFVENNKLIIVIENLDVYKDEEIDFASESFRISQYHMLIVQLVTILNESAPVSNSRFVYTAENLLHGYGSSAEIALRNPEINNGQKPTSGGLKKHADNAENASQLTPQELRAEREVADFLKTQSEIKSPSPSSSFINHPHFRRLALEDQSATSFHVQNIKHLNKFLKNMRASTLLGLRIVATSFDGIRENSFWHTLRHLDENYPEVVTDVQFSTLLDRLKQFHGPLLQATTTIDKKHNVFSVPRDELRGLILAHWETHKLSQARRVYRVLGYLALKRASGNSDEDTEQFDDPGRQAPSPEQAETQRWIQAAKFLLASIDGDRIRPADERSSKGTGVTTNLPKDQIPEDFFRRINARANDTYYYVYNIIWQRFIEHERDWRLVRRYGLSETKFWLLLSFLCPGTVFPRNIKSSIDANFTGRQQLIPDNEAQTLLTSFIVTCVRTGRNLLARDIGAHVQSVIRKDTLPNPDSDVHTFYRTLSDAEFRLGYLNDALHYCRYGMSILIEWLIFHTNQKNYSATLRLENEYDLYDLLNYEKFSEELFAMAEELKISSAHDKIMHKLFCKTLVSYICRFAELLLFKGKASDAQAAFAALLRWCYLPTQVDGGNENRASSSLFPTLAGENARRYLRYLFQRLCVSGHHEVGVFDYTRKFISNLHEIAHRRGFEHDKVALKIDELRFRRLKENMSIDEIERRYGELDKILQESGNIGVSRILGFHAKIEQIKYHVLRNLNGSVMLPDHRLELNGAFEVAKSVYESAQSNGLKMVELESILLLAEIHGEKRQEYISRYDEKVSTTDIQFFELPRTFILKNVSPTALSVW